MASQRHPIPNRSLAITIALSCVLAGASMAMLLVSTGCDSGLSRVDRHTDALLREANKDVGPDTVVPVYDPEGFYEGRSFPRDSGDLERPDTNNPGASDLVFVARPESDDEINSVINRLEQENLVPDDAMILTPDKAMELAVNQSLEYELAEEQYFIVAMTLLIQRHIWSPQFFDRLTPSFTADGIDGRFQTALNLVNELGVRQKLPYGGEVSARMLVQATEQLHDAVSAQNVQSADILLGARIPILQGAGMVARESLIQAERNLIYAARTFERFRRTFYFSLLQDYLSLVVQIQGIENSKRQIERLEEVDSRSQALVDAGREIQYQADLAKQQTLFAIDSLNNKQDQLKLSIDRFKLRIGIDVQIPVIIPIEQMSLPIPDVTPDDAVLLALDYRLDLQTRRDQVQDARRDVDVSRNNLLPGLNLDMDAVIPTDPDKTRAGVDFDPNWADFTAALRFEVPLDKTVEQIQMRQSQIQLETTRRQYLEGRDQIALEARRAVRGIDRSLFSLELQEQNLEIAFQRQESIEVMESVAQGRVTTRDKADAIDAWLAAQDQHDQARADVQVAIIGYLLSTGQLRINPDGTLMSLPGMEEAIEEGDTFEDAAEDQAIIDQQMIQKP